MDINKREMLEEVELLKKELHRLLVEDPQNTDKILEISQRIDQLIYLIYYAP